MSKLMEQVKIAGSNIDKALQNIDKDYEPVDKIQEGEDKNMNKEDKNNKKDYSENVNFGLLGGTAGAVVGGLAGRILVPGAGGLPGAIAGGYIGHKVENYTNAKTQQQEEKAKIRRLLLATGKNIEDADKLVAPVENPITDTIDTIKGIKDMPVEMRKFSDPESNLVVVDEKPKSSKAPLVAGAVGLGAGLMAVPKDKLADGGRALIQTMGVNGEIINEKVSIGNPHATQSIDILEKEGYVKGSEAYKNRLKFLKNMASSPSSAPIKRFVNIKQVAPYIARSNPAKLKIAAMAAVPATAAYILSNTHSNKEVKPMNNTNSFSDPEQYEVKNFSNPAAFVSKTATNIMNTVSKTGAKVEPFVVDLSKTDLGPAIAQAVGYEIFKPRGWAKVGQIAKNAAVGTYNTGVKAAKTAGKTAAVGTGGAIAIDQYAKSRASGERKDLTKARLQAYMSGMPIDQVVAVFSDPEQYEVKNFGFVQDQVKSLKDAYTKVGNDIKNEGLVKGYIKANKDAINEGKTIPQMINKGLNKVGSRAYDVINKSK